MGATAGDLARVERAEDALSRLGFADFRVRLREDGARIQVTAAQMALARAKWEEILEQLKPDFTDVLLDQTPRQASR